MIRFKLSPELSDGDRWNVVNTKSEVLEHIEIWFEHHSDCEGEEFSVEVVDMTDKRFNALPDL